MSEAYVATDSGGREKRNKRANAPSNNARGAAAAFQELYEHVQLHRREEACARLLGAPLEYSQTVLI
jgi:hypothetical protein